MKKEGGLKGGKASVWGNVIDVSNIMKNRKLATCIQSHSLIEVPTRGYNVC